MNLNLNLPQTQHRYFSLSLKWWARSTIWFSLSIHSLVDDTSALTRGNIEPVGLVWFEKRLTEPNQTQPANNWLVYFFFKLQKNIICMLNMQK